MNLLLRIFSLIFGLMPFNSTKLYSNIALDYALVVFMPLLYLFCYYYTNIQGFSVYQLAECNSICRLSSTLFMYVGCFLYFTCHFQTIIRRKSFYIEFRKRLKEIDEISAYCVRMADDHNELVVPKKKRLYYITWILVLSAFGFAVFYDVKEVFKYYGLYCFISNMVITFPYVAGSILQGIFVSYVSIISERFRVLNTLFDKVNNESDKRNSLIAALDVENDSKKYNNKGIAVINKFSNNKVENRIHGSTKSVNTSNNIESDIADEYNAADGVYFSEAYDEASLSNGKSLEVNLPDLFELHDKILSLSVLVNSEFGAQCVPFMAACFVITIFGIFLETKVMFIVGGLNELMDYVIYLYVIWSFTTMMVGYLVLRLCCNAHAYSKQSALIVHEIMQKKPSFMLGNNSYYNKMKAFTLQFLHWEGYFQFNGIGLFALDYTFIFSTVSAATSYLIVLLQFDMTAILKSEGLT